MPVEHRMYLSYNKKEFTDWANTVGASTAAVVKYFLTSGKEAEQGYKYCASLTKPHPEHHSQEWAGPGAEGT